MKNKAPDKTKPIIAEVMANDYKGRKLSFAERNIIKMEAKRLKKLNRIPK